MNCSAFADVLDLHIGEEPVRARDVTDGMRVRISGWSGYHVALAAEPLSGPYVRVLWRCDAGDDPPGPFTVCGAGEWVAVLSA